MEKGLLAGLHEFPSRVNVKGNEAENQTSLRQIGQEELKNVLGSTIPPYIPSNVFGLKSTKSANSGDTTYQGLRIARMQSMGDVLHIFSHIRKTYRIQWILLEGQEILDRGDELPALNENFVFSGGTNNENSEKTLKSSKKGVKNKEKDLDKSTESKSSPKELELRWVQYEDVPKAKYVPISSHSPLYNVLMVIFYGSIGTGVMKVWKKANESWAVRTLT